VITIYHAKVYTIDVKQTKPFLRSKQNTVLLVIIVLGLLITAFSVIYYYLPIPRAAEDADLGGAGFAIIGIPIFVLGIVGLILSLSSARFDKHKQTEFSSRRLLKLIILAAVILFMALVIGGALVDIFGGPQIH